MKPRIGVTASLSVHEERAVEALERAYLRAVAAAGGVPLIVPVGDPAEVGDVAAGLDGILISGGGDVNPRCYGEAPRPEVDLVEPERDRWELALARHAMASGVPVLGTCRGSQVLNVAAGGTLVQHLPELTTRQHCERERWGEVVHMVEVAPASVLRTVVGADVVGVNSLHHQAVRRVGSGLRVVAWADDGVIEAVEGVAGTPALGVQWHPELLPAEPAHAALFAWLVDQAGGYRRIGGSQERRPAAGPALAVAVA